MFHELGVNDGFDRRVLDKVAAFSAISIFVGGSILCQQAPTSAAILTSSDTKLTVYSPSSNNNTDTSPFVLQRFDTNLGSLNNISLAISRSFQQEFGISNPHDVDLLFAWQTSTFTYANTGSASGQRLLTYFLSTTVPAGSNTVISLTGQLEDQNFFFYTPASPGGTTLPPINDFIGLGSFGAPLTFVNLTDVPSAPFFASLGCNPNSPNSGPCLTLNSVSPYSFVTTLTVTYDYTPVPEPRNAVSSSIFGFFAIAIRKWRKKLSCRLSTESAPYPKRV
jgi:hypothetical protein